jgi:hypothetical protein
MSSNRNRGGPRTSLAISAPIAVPTISTTQMQTSPELPSFFQGTSNEALKILSALKPTEKRVRLGAPIKMEEADWLAYLASRAELPAGVSDEMDVRMMILAQYLNVDPFDPDWWIATAQRVTARLLAGGEGPKRRFPIWVLGTEKNTLSRPGPSNGPFFVIRPDGRRRAFTTRQLDQAKALMDSRAKGVPKVEAVMPLLKQLGTPGSLKAAARSLLNAVRYQSRLKR